MEIIQLIIGLASIVSVVAVIWALRKVMKIYDITVDIPSAIENSVLIF